MTQTGTGLARVMRVFKRRVDELWPDSAGKVWYPEDVDFTPPPHTKPPANPAAILRIQPNRSFEDPLGFGGKTSKGNGSISLIHGVQVRAGMLDQQEAGETAIRAIIDVNQNDEAEDVWTMPNLEVNPRVRPQGISEAIANAFDWTQYVPRIKFAEGFL